MIKSDIIETCYVCGTENQPNLENLLDSSEYYSNLVGCDNCGKKLGGTEPHLISIVAKLAEKVEQLENKLSK